MVLKLVDIFVEVPLKSIEEEGRLYVVTQRIGLVSEKDASWETISGLYLKKKESVYVFNKEDLDNFIEQISSGKPIVKLI